MAVSVVILDYSCQAVLNPVESLISDICRVSSSETVGFLIYSAMSSFGLCLGYLMAGINWGSSVMTNEQTAFTTVSMFLVLALAVTMAFAREELQSGDRRQSLDCLIKDDCVSSEPDDSSASPACRVSCPLRRTKQMLSLMLFMQG